MTCHRSQWSHETKTNIDLSTVINDQDIITKKSLTVENKKKQKSFKATLSVRVCGKYCT